MLQDINNIQHTFFFWSDGISAHVRDFYHSQSHYIAIDRCGKKRKQGLLRLLNRVLFYIKPLYSYLYYPFKWPFVLRDDIKYYGADHLSYSQFIFRKHCFELLEDGSMNYYPHNSFPVRSPKQEKILNLLYGQHFSRKTYYAGDEQECTKIHLSGLQPIPEDYPQKYIIQTFDYLWNRCDVGHQAYINSVYGLNECILSKLKASSKILLTRPFSEDGVMSECEKIDLYTKIANKIGRKGLVIKKHPREKTNYSMFFPDVNVIEESIPMQLFSFNGIRFEEAYAICTTAIFDFPYHIKVGYIGSEIDPRIEKVLPNLTKEKVSFEGKDVEVIEFDF